MTMTIECPEARSAFTANYSEVINQTTIITHLQYMMIDGIGILCGKRNYTDTMVETQRLHWIVVPNLDFVVFLQFFEIRWLIKRYFNLPRAIRC